MKNIIEIQHLSKSFGEIKAVQDLSFRVKEGELFAFLGINGAGKSTTISILCGQLAKDGGTVRIDGADLDRNIDAVKQNLGVVFQNSVLDKALNVRDNLKSRAALYGITGKAFEARLQELANLLDFSDLLKRTVGKLSGGQRRRIDIARALLHSPKILILDEPTTGLDPQTRKLLWDAVSQLRRIDIARALLHSPKILILDEPTTGLDPQTRKLLWDAVSQLRREKKMTVFLTTHYMEEAADADYVIILDSGKIAAEGTPLQLKNTYTGDFITLYGADAAQVQSLGIPYEVLHGAYRLAIPNTQAATQLITVHPDLFTDYEIVKGKMDDVFLAVTGKHLVGGEQV